MLSKDPEKLSEQQLVEQDATTGGLLQSAPQLGLDGTLEDGLADTIAHQSAESERIAGNNSDSGTSVNSLIGKTIGGHYQILSQIGTGGMGAVYEAKHLLLLKLVAIKIISAARASDSKVLMRFQQEAKAASSLIHQNIAMVSEFGQAADGSPFLVMEKVKGKPLSQVIKEEGKLTQERSVSIMLQLCDALNYAHEQSVIHRDIKPANIILTEDADGREVVKIVDFGIAKVLSDDGADLTQTGEVFGTPNYMSPEQCLGKPVDRRSDIYSLGCVFEEMLSGAPPFSAGSALETLMMHVNETPSARHSPLVSDVILRALEKQPLDRFQNAKEMTSALLSLQQGNYLNLQSQVPSRRRLAMGLLVGGLVTAAAICLAVICFSIAKTETQKLCIVVSLVLYIGAGLNILVSTCLKKR